MSKISEDTTEQNIVGDRTSSTSSFDEFISKDLLSTRTDSDIKEINEQRYFKQVKDLGSKAQEQILSNLQKYVDDKIEKIEFEFAEEGKKLENKIESSKIKVIETLGIFVALFTLISVEFQIFRLYENAVTIGGLTLIILGSLLIFITVADAVLSNNLSWENKKSRLIPIWLFLIVAGIFCFILSPETQDKYVKYTREEYGSYVQKYLTLDKSVNELTIFTNKLDAEILTLKNNAVTSSSLLSLNIGRDNSMAVLKSELEEQQSVLNCMKGVKYWQYNECLK